MTVQNIFDFLNKLFPVNTACDFDNAGLLIGDGDAEVKKALVSLDCTKKTVENAKENGCNLIITHHPVIFALGRTLYKKVPPRLQSAFNEGNLLFISFRNYTRHSWNSALQRNWGIADLADEIYFTQFDHTSSLNTLQFTLDRYSNKAVYVLR